MADYIIKVLEERVITEVWPLI